jgi:3-hydroxyacyl-CoA dehydrogenase/enoyl-CoA hydratase/3-hydroxybutyryl-CoA epimerase
MNNQASAPAIPASFTNVIGVTIEQDKYAVLTIDQIENRNNVIDQSMLDALEWFVSFVQSNEQIEGAVITSAKSTFIAGGDLNSIEAGINRRPLPARDALLAECFSLSKILRTLETGGKPYVCALNGVAMGGGLEIALACHRRILAEKPRLFLGLPEVQLGLLPGAGGTQRVLRLTGITTAVPFLIEGKPVSGGKALELGLVDATAPADSLIEHALAWLQSEPEAVAPWDKDSYRIPGGTATTNPAVKTFLEQIEAAIQKNTQGNYPAPLAILRCVREGSILGMDEALGFECARFVDLTLDPTSKAMIRTLFVHKTKADKLASRPRGPKPRPVATLGLIGAGTMGSSIAFAAASRGMNVVLLDRSEETAERGLDYGRNKLAHRIKRGYSTEEKGQEILSRITPVADPIALASCELIVEAVFEDREVKSAVIKNAGKVVGGKTIFASNTSALPITQLAENHPNPERFIGLHFFSPADKMPLVEIIKGKQTSDETLAWAMDFIAQLGKTPIIVNDNRGFFTSRFIGAYIDEGIGMIAEGICPELIEKAARSLSMPMGPLTISDLIGLDLSLQASAQAKRDLGKDFEPGKSLAIIQTVVDAGRNGIKNGKGFYEYENGSKAGIWSGLSKVYQLKKTQPSIKDISARLLLVQVNEALLSMQEGVLNSPEDGDLGAILGVGFPSWTGGPFSYFDRIGAQIYVDECDELQRKFGNHLAAPDIAITMAKQSEYFYHQVNR